MIHDFKPYPAMKDSGVPWLGEVPAHWEMRRLKTLCRMRSGESITGLSIDEVGDYPVFGGNGIRGYTSAYTHEGEYILIGRQGALCGNIHRARGRFWASEHAVVASLSPGNDLIWYGELLRAMNLNQYSMAAAQPGLAVERVLNLYAPVPPSDEQSAIARFLDHADRRIRRYIRAKQELIRLLKEQKQSILHRAVTRGLDPNVRLKTSGVEWLGYVPEHWEVRRLGQIAAVYNGTTPSRMHLAYWQDGTIPWLSSGKVNDDIVKTASELVTERALKECSISLVPQGAVILGLVGQGKTRGMSALLAIDACINQNLAAIVPRRGIDGRFLHHFLTAFYRSLREFGRGGNQEALNCEIVAQFRISIPPLAEQEMLCDYLRTALQESLRAQARIEHEISLLREYRSRLIADVVTGKLDVRAAATSLPDEPDEPEAMDDTDALVEDERAEDGDLGDTPEHVAA